MVCLGGFVFWVLLCLVVWFWVVTVVACGWGCLFLIFCCYLVITFVGWVGGLVCLLVGCG